MVYIIGFNHCIYGAKVGFHYLKEGINGTWMRYCIDYDTNNNQLFRYHVPYSNTTCFHFLVDNIIHKGGSPTMINRPILRMKATFRIFHDREWGCIDGFHWWVVLVINRYMMIYGWEMIQSGWWSGTFVIFQYNDPNWRSLIFQRGRAQPPTSNAW